MLGKASELKHKTISAEADFFDGELFDWRQDHPNAEIVEIKFSATSLTGHADCIHALIIYKEVPHE